MRPWCLFFLLGIFGAVGATDIDTVTVIDDNFNALAMKPEDGAKFLQLLEVVRLEGTIENINSEKKDLAEKHLKQMQELRKEKTAIEQKYKDKLKKINEGSMNKNVMVRVLKRVLQNSYKNVDPSNCQETFNSNGQELSKLVIERSIYDAKNNKHLEQAFLQMEVISNNEHEKEVLRETLKQEKENFNLPNNFKGVPAFVQHLTKFLANQHTKIVKLREDLGKKDEVKELVEKVMQSLNVLTTTFSSDHENADRLQRSQEVIATQAKSLTSLKPAINIVVQNSRNTSYKMDDEGGLLGSKPCQCQPDTKDSGITVTGLTVTCPANTVSTSSLERVSDVPCQDGLCPAELELTCGNLSMTPWTTWTKCDTDCQLLKSYRRRKHLEPNGNVADEFEIKGQSPMIVTAVGQTIVDLWLPHEGKLGVFVMGGGGSADSVVSGSSGFFNYTEYPVEHLARTASGSVRVNITVGEGGYIPRNRYNGSDYDDYDEDGDGRADGDYGPLWILNGQNSTVVLGDAKPIIGYGGKGGENGETRVERGEPVAGWSGGDGSKGGENGSSGGDYPEGEGNGSWLPLPQFCGEGVTLAPGAAGDFDGNDGTGAGGVVVNGKKPARKFRRDGEGYGAGGGEDEYAGYGGVVVLLFCSKA